MSNKGIFLLHYSEVARRVLSLLSEIKARKIGGDGICTAYLAELTAMTASGTKQTPKLVESGLC